jgi:NAD(P)H-hydrate epimerase
MIPSHPILSNDAARALEVGLFGGDERAEWKAMLHAGHSAACDMIRDSAESGGFPAAGRLLVLAGKGNNAGDALIAARTILERYPDASGDVVFAFGPRKLRPLAARAWRGLCESCRGRFSAVGADGLSRAYDMCIDGIFGYQYRPPLPAEALAAIAAADTCKVKFRASIDLPSGLAEGGAYRADFTYATGSVKSQLIGCANAGRLRYIDLGFFGDLETGASAADGDRVVLPSVLEALAGLRPASSDKRSLGHLAILGGSGSFPGAVLMATLSALRSGVGLVTAFVPEHLAPVFASRAPEAMWVGLPETAEGGLALGGLAAFQKRSERATALAVGPGLGRDPETHSLVMEIVKAATAPIVIDADALQHDVVRAGASARILTPHAGELARIADGGDLRAFCAVVHGAVIAKGPLTRVSSGGAVYYSLFGGPVLSRGGSGDLLAGMTGGLLAQTPAEPLKAACQAAVWHGMAADQLARAHGQTAVRTLQLLDFLAPALRESAACPAS